MEYRILVAAMLVLASGCITPQADTKPTATTPSTTSTTTSTTTTTTATATTLPGVDCSSHSVESCPPECVICPPCEVCSSVSCQTEAYCRSLGFARDWWETVKPKPTSTTSSITTSTTTSATTTVPTECCYKENMKTDYGLNITATVHLKCDDLICTNNPGLCYTCPERPGG